MLVSIVRVLEESVEKGCGEWVVKGRRMVFMVLGLVRW